MAAPRMGAAGCRGLYRSRVQPGSYGSFCRHRSPPNRRAFLGIERLADRRRAPVIPAIAPCLSDFPIRKAPPSRGFPLPPLFLPGPAADDIAAGGELAFLPPRNRDAYDQPPAQ